MIESECQMSMLQSSLNNASASTLFLCASPGAMMYVCKLSKFVAAAAALVDNCNHRCRRRVCIFISPTRSTSTEHVEKNWNEYFATSHSNDVYFVENIMILRLLCRKIDSV
jgi:hypothetical protein